MTRPAVWVGIVPMGKPFHWQVHNKKARRAGERSSKSTGSFAGKKCGVAASFREQNRA